MMPKFTKDGIYSLLVYIGVFLYALYPYSDYDWGWHYRYGEYFLKFGTLLRTNPYSWTLPNFHWINPSWLYDPILYLLYTHTHFLGLSVAAALISLLIFYILIKPFHLFYWQKGILAGCYCEIASGVVWQGLRSQTLGSFFLALLMTILWYAEKRSRVLYVLPVLFFVWANVHGVFTLGIAITSLYIGLKLVSVYVDKKNSWHFLDDMFVRQLFVVLMLCFLATLINPFTYHIYTEVFKHWNNPWLSRISEWMPVQFSLRCPGCNMFIVYSMLLVIGSALVLYYEPSFMNIFYVLNGAAFLYLATTARRYLEQFAIVTLPFAALLLALYTKGARRYKIMPILFLTFMAILFEQTIFVRLPPFHLLNYTFDDYCRFSSGCSNQTADYLTKNPPKGIGFNFYDWGGFFIGKGVPAKTFVDGRMTVWNEGVINPFADHENIYYDKNMQLFMNYHFQWVVIARGSDLANSLLSPKHEFGTWDIKFSDGNTIYLVKRP